MSTDPREDLALLRFRIIGEAINPRLTPAERGHLVRELANQAYEHPDGSRWTYSRVTLDRWIRAYREHGLDGLRPPPRADLGGRWRCPWGSLGRCELRLEARLLDQSGTRQPRRYSPQLTADLAQFRV